MVRIDRFLQHVNLLPSRKDAKTFLDEKLVTINDNLAKPASKVKDNDIITLYFEEEVLKVKARIEKVERIIYVGYEIISRHKKVFSAC